MFTPDPQSISQTRKSARQTRTIVPTN